MGAPTLTTYNAKVTLQELIACPDVMRPNTYQLNALGAAVLALNERYGDTQEARILGYHIKEPSDDIFRDKYTLRALRAWLEALEWKEKRERDAG